MQEAAQAPAERPVILDAVEGLRVGLLVVVNGWWWRVEGYSKDQGVLVLVPQGRTARVLKGERLRQRTLRRKLHGLGVKKRKVRK